MTQKPFQIPNPNFDETRATSPMRQLLERNQLSKLPPVPRRAGCENCKGRLDGGDEFQIAVGLCKSCLRTYAVVGSLLEKYTERKIRQIYQGGASE